MTILKQIVCKDCFYENELHDCPNLCSLTFEHIKTWLQQKRINIKSLCELSQEQQDLIIAYVDAELLEDL